MTTTAITVLPPVPSGWTGGLTTVQLQSAYDYARTSNTVAWSIFLEGVRRGYVPDDSLLSWQRWGYWTYSGYHATGNNLDYQIQAGLYDLWVLEERYVLGLTQTNAVTYANSNAARLGADLPTWLDAITRGYASTFVPAYQISTQQATPGPTTQQVTLTQGSFIFVLGPLGAVAQGTRAVVARKLFQSYSDGSVKEYPWERFSAYYVDEAEVRSFHGPTSGDQAAIKAVWYWETLSAATQAEILNDLGTSAAPIYYTPPASSTIQPSTPPPPSTPTALPPPTVSGAIRPSSSLPTGGVTPLIATSGLIAPVATSPAPTAATAAPTPTAPTDKRVWLLVGIGVLLIVFAAGRK